MPWNWQGRGATSTELGGTRGSYEEAKIAHAWPNYEAEYLAKRLEEGGGKYAKGPGGKAPTEIANFVYYDKVTDDYKQEADECLKKEFNQWLVGEHPDNDERALYENAAGKPVRKAIYREKGEEPGQPLKNEWRPTHWGKAQLTHLPGVREYLREQKEISTKNEFAMNLLAEHGPQNLEEAWMYFKHWVKGRPVGPEICMTPAGTPGYKSIAGRIPPDNEKGEIISGYRYPQDRAPTPMEVSDAAENTATQQAGSSTRDASATEEMLRETVRSLEEQLRTGAVQFENLRRSTFSQQIVQERFQEAGIILKALQGELSLSEAQYNQLQIDAETRYQQLRSQAGVEIQNLQQAAQEWQGSAEFQAARRNELEEQFSTLQQQAFSAVGAQQEEIQNLQEQKNTLEAERNQMTQAYTNYVQHIQTLADAQIQMQRQELAKQVFETEAERLEKANMVKNFREFEKQMQEKAAEQQAAIEEERQRLTRLNATAREMYESKKKIYEERQRFEEQAKVLADQAREAIKQKKAADFKKAHDMMLRAAAQVTKNVRKRLKHDNEFNMEAPDIDIPSRWGPDESESAGSKARKKADEITASASIAREKKIAENKEEAARQHQMEQDFAGYEEAVVMGDAF